MDELRRCPYCGVEIREGAIRCGFCGEFTELDNPVDENDLVEVEEDANEGDSTFDQKSGKEKHQFSILSIFCVVLLIAAGVASYFELPALEFAIGNSFYEGMWGEADYSSAVEWYRLSAENGYPEAQRKLADCLVAGEGTEVNLAEAMKFYREAATAGVDYARLQLGIGLLTGKGVEQNPEEAFQWLSQVLPETDPVETNFYLGEYYLRFAAGEDAKAKAVEHYRRAANQGHAQSQYELAMLLLTGEGVEQDLSGAFRLFSEAAAAGIVPAYFQLGECYAKELGTAMDEALALENYRKAAGNGILEAQLILGERSGNDAESFYWYMQAAEQKSIPAAYQVGYRLYYGIGAEKNVEESLQWLTRAAEAQDVSAQLLLGDVYTFGAETEANPEQGRFWYDRAVAAGAEVAEYNLAVMLFRGEGGEMDRQRAFQLFQNGAQRQEVSAVFAAGICAQYGAGTNHDPEKAIALFKQAVELGVHEAEFALGKVLLAHGVCWPDEPEMWIQRAADNGVNAAEEFLLGRMIGEALLLALWEQTELIPAPIAFLMTRQGE